MSEALLNLYLRREPGGYKYDEDRTACRHEISGSSRTLGCKFCLVGNPHLIPSRARRVINICSGAHPEYRVLSCFLVYYEYASHLTKL